MGIEHLSPSTAQSYRKCGKQVYYQKILGIPNPQQYGMTVYGSAMHHAIEMLYKNKLSQQDYIAEFITEFMKNCGDVTVWKADTVGSLIEEGKIACIDFYNTIYGKYDVVEIEKKYNIDRGEGSLPILCIADAVTSKGEVIDYKFGRGLTGTANSKGYACNMATYAWAYQTEHNGELPSKIIFIKEKWKYKTNAQKERVYHHDCFIIDEQDAFVDTIDFYKDVYNNVEVGIQAGVWLPADDESFFCKSCGYRLKGICKKDVS